ncbi:hypothetical protein [Saccharopolyspora rosea]|uniref:hypothetical protein n=1 Tax=Saccharopolyspora rosea TaxID=524884 RepID=UPI0021DB5902|nr:hypothetical protein [Saccharopolyspora rosea]
MWRSLLPNIGFGLGFALMMVADRGHRWVALVGAVLGVVAFFSLVSWWGSFSDSDGVMQVKLTPGAWIARLVSYVLGCFSLGLSGLALAIAVFA